MRSQSPSNLMTCQKSVRPISTLTRRVDAFLAYRL